MRVLEGRIETKAVEYAISLGYMQMKLTPAGQRGWMDRVFINQHGVHVYVEFKRQGLELEKLQAFRRWQLQQRKCIVYGPVDNFEEAKEILDDWVDKGAVVAEALSRESDSSSDHAGESGATA